ncbi:uncharacterized protein LOC120641839 isoform X2 [Panicum virgatum]|uniref:uncharacterized protein LOC120641839 isoform X2 n=1 Tax=Panicum virgatum TaxID=38727 RepID=UPI0019D58B66|nr:uncharacterized protein LOC120641839 isoform X2 [Panicum virgatum]
MHCRRKSSSALHPQDAPPPGGSGRPPVAQKRFQTGLSPARPRALIRDGFISSVKELRFLLAAIERVWANFVHYDRAKEIVWLLEFQTFDDKSSAISVGTGINKQLTEMIMKRRNPGQTLVVGKQEYKSIIESSLGIHCLHNEIVKDVMWGMQRHMHRLVPMEKSELPKEDRVPMSQGLQMLLSRHGFHVKPKMINEEIVVAALSLFKYDVAKKEEYPPLRRIGGFLKDVSGIDCKNWRALKIATAFKIICTHEIGDSDETLSKDLQIKLLEDADRYQDLIDGPACIVTYRRLMYAHRDITQSKGIFASLVKKAKASESVLEEHGN